MKGSVSSFFTSMSRAETFDVILVSFCRAHHLLFEYYVVDDLSVCMMRSTSVFIFTVFFICCFVFLCAASV